VPRPPKERMVCRLPLVSEFSPAGTEPCCEPIVMTVDEYESIHLIDLEGLSQQECAEQMGVARTTAQTIYGNARKKLARCLIEGRRLVIEGGDYRVCPGGRNDCCRRNCHRAAGTGGACGA